MAQHFKYNTGSTINNTTQKGNIAIATSGTYDWGPTSVTGYYPETTPPAGGYTIYYMRATGGPSIEVATSDAQALFLLQSFGATGSTISDALAWASNTANYYVQTGTTIVTSGLTLNLDASNATSYPGTGTTWNDLSGNGYNATMQGSAPFTSAGQQSYFGYSNSSGYFTGNNNLTSKISTALTIQVVASITDVTARSFLFAKYQSSAPGGFVLEAGTISGLWTNTLRFYVGGNSTGYDLRGTTSPLVNNTKYLFTITYSAPLGGQFYLNGATLAGSNSAFGADSAWSTGTNNYTVGSLTTAGGGGPYVSYMNQYMVLVYNRALSSTEVTQNYTALQSRFGI
jgi:hypothetical protein